MMVLVTYDVNIQTADGEKRLRKVAKTCLNYGVRVQNSVFECVVDAVGFKELKHILSGIIDFDKDSLRFYNLGNQYQQKIEHIGARESISVEECIIL